MAKPSCLSHKDLKKITDSTEILKIIADESRLKIICALKNSESCVCDIWKFVNLPQNLVSHHLGILKKAGLVNSRRNGLNIYYSLNKNEIEHHLESFEILIS